MHLGGAGRMLNLQAAMKLGGFKDAEIVYKAMDAREFEFNEKMLVENDPRNERSWIHIDAESYLQWIEKRNQIEIGAARKYAHEVLIKLGLLQAQMYNLEHLVRTLIDNRRTQRPARPRIRRYRA